MKKNAGLIALALAVVFGILAVFLANKWLTNRSSNPTVMVEDRVPLTKIVVAAKDLSIGAPLNKDTLALTDWPKSAVPKGAFFDIQAVADRVAVTKLTAGEPVLAAELAAPGSGAGMVALIEPGMRAMALKVDEVTGVGGFVLPNTYVDVIGVEKRKNNDYTSDTILHRIKVLAIAQETFTEEGKAKIVRTVTLELKSEDAEKLALQTHKGSAHLVLRNPLDEEEPVAKKVVAKKKKRIYRPRVRHHKMEIYRGGDKPEVVKFRHADSERRI